MMEHVAADRQASAARDAEIGGPLQRQRMERLVRTRWLVEPENLPADGAFGAHGSGNDDTTQRNILRQGSACAGADQCLRTWA